MDPNPPIGQTPPRRRNVAAEIWSGLRESILRGELAPGSRLVELDIAGRAGASQASVREALQRLERDGLVVRRGRKGSFVTEVSPEEMHETFAIRSMVEGFAIRRTARSITAPQLHELESLVEEMRHAARHGDATRLVAHDMAFHQRICAWAGHPTLLRVWTILQGQLERFLVIYDQLHFVDLTEVADNHLPIVAALRVGDAALAVREIERHVVIGAPPAPGG